MRVSKEPEVRKQEIIDAAMRVFAEKGYEAASMKDIAGAADVVAGLCYHYFHSKQELYETAVTQYAQECSEAFISVFKQTHLTLEEVLALLEKILLNQAPEYKYKEFFDKEGNEFFHKQLELYMSKAVFPYMHHYLNCLAERGDIPCEHTNLLAHFLWAGQLAVVSDETVPMGERIEFMKKMIGRLVI